MAKEQRKSRERHCNRALLRLSISQRVEFVFFFTMSGFRSEVKT
jgi:hypothetical protein